MTAKTATSTLILAFSLLAAGNAFSATDPDMFVVRTALHSFLSEEPTARQTSILTPETSLADGVTLERLQKISSVSVTSSTADEWKSNNATPLDISGLALAESVPVVASDFATAGRYDASRLASRYPGREKILLISKPVYPSGGVAIVSISTIDTNNKRTDRLFRLEKASQKWWVKASEPKARQ